MAWKCPQCKQTNDNELKKCTCGYAYYDVLGLKEDTSDQSVEQAYKYLIKVWETPAEAHNASSRGKLDERVKKINDAYAIFRLISKETDNNTKKPPILKIAVAAVAAIVVIIAAVFLFSPNQKAALQSVSSTDQMATTEKSASAPATQPVVSPQPIPQPVSERITDTPDMSGDKTPDWAIESVKKSHALDRFSTVDTLVNKWTKESSDKLKAIGWIARRVDEKAYLVSYTATDGLTPTGFYFEINVETGEIRNIAGNAELQQKYGIKGN